MNLQFGGGEVQRLVEHAEDLLEAYRFDDGLRYLDYEPITPRDRLVPEDLAVTILINSRVGPAAFMSVQDRGTSLRLGDLAAVALEETTDGERDQVADVVCEVATWPGFAASVATKVLHKKRPALIPILDNQAIFGAYLSPTWPKVRSSQDSVYAKSRVKAALDSIWFDLNRPENELTWKTLRSMAPRRTGVELLDMVWWMHFRSLEPVKPTSPI